MTMKTNIRKPITPEMLETLPKGYAIYGNGSDDFAALIARAGSPAIIFWLGGMLRSWCRPRNFVGNKTDSIYAVPIGSVLYSLLCEDETQNEEPMTIAQMLGVKEFPFKIRDKRGRVIYSENSHGFWWRREYDSSGNRTYYETSHGICWRREYDSLGNQTYYEDSKGVKRGTPRSEIKPISEMENHIEPDTEQTEDSRLLLDSIKAIVERDGASTIELRIGNNTLIPHEWGLHGDKLWIELRGEG